METQLIITHPGRAHFDEVTAISLILAAYPNIDFRIERREPTPRESGDPRVWVIDIGGRHEPKKLNFDHHQALECPAAFVLVAEHLGLSETLSVLPWWSFKDSEDRVGFVRSSLKYNAGDELVNRNPVENWLTETFSTAPQDSINMLWSYGSHIIKNAQRLKRQIDYWKTCQRIEIAGVPAMVGESKEYGGLEEFRRLEPNPPDIVITADSRSEGWRLFRYEGTPVDFTRIADRPEIDFAHKSGFLAKTKKKMPLNDLVALVSRAIVK